MNIFDIIDSAVKGSMERWEAIEKRQAEVKKMVEEGETPDTKTLALFLVDIVDHLRPMMPSHESVSKVTEELKDIVASKSK